MTGRSEEREVLDELVSDIGSLLGAGLAAMPSG